MADGDGLHDERIVFAGRERFVVSFDGLFRLAEVVLAAGQRQRKLLLRELLLHPVQFLERFLLPLLRDEELHQRHPAFRIVGLPFDRVAEVTLRLAELAGGGHHLGHPDELPRVAGVLADGQAHQLDGLAHLAATQCDGDGEPAEFGVVQQRLLERGEHHLRLALPAGLGQQGGEFADDGGARVAVLPRLLQLLDGLLRRAGQLGDLGAGEEDGRPVGTQCQHRVEVAARLVQPVGGGPRGVVAGLPDQEERFPVAVVRAVGWLDLADVVERLLHTGLVGILHRQVEQQHAEAEVALVLGQLGERLPHRAGLLVGVGAEQRIGQPAQEPALILLGELAAPFAESLDLADGRLVVDRGEDAGKGQAQGNAIGERLLAVLEQLLGPRLVLLAEGDIDQRGEEFRLAGNLLAGGGQDVARAFHILLAQGEFRPQKDEFEVFRLEEGGGTLQGVLGPAPIGLRIRPLDLDLQPGDVEPGARRHSLLLHGLLVMGERLAELPLCPPSGRLTEDGGDGGRILVGDALEGVEHLGVFFEAFVALPEVEVRLARQVALAAHLGERPLEQLGGRPPLQLVDVQAALHVVGGGGHVRLAHLLDDGGDLRQLLGVVVERRPIVPRDAREVEVIEEQVPLVPEELELQRLVGRLVLPDQLETALEVVERLGAVDGHSLASFVDGALERLRDGADAELLEVGGSEDHVERFGASLDGLGHVARGGLEGNIGPARAGLADRHQVELAAVAPAGEVGIAVVRVALYHVAQHLIGVRVILLALVRVGLGRPAQEIRQADRADGGVGGVQDREAVAADGVRGLLVLLLELAPE